METVTDTIKTGFLDKVIQRLQATNGKETTSPKNTLIEWAKGCFIEESEATNKEAILFKTGILDSHRKCKYKWTKELTEYWDIVLKKLFKSGSLFVFYGDRRSGKSQFAAEIIRHCVGKNKSCLYVHAQDLLDEIFYSKDKLDAINKFKKKNFLLVIDEFQRPSYTRNDELRLINGLLTYRFDDDRSTIILSNFKKEEHTKLFDASVNSRLSSSRGMKCFNGMNPVEDLLFEKEER